MSLVDRYASELTDELESGALLADAMRDLTIRHEAHLRELGPVRVVALDPCPRCGGQVVASETVAKCTRCDYTVAGGLA